jgi:mitochondrial import receptor subunit TOM40
MGLTYSRADSTSPPPLPSFADLTSATANAIKESAKAEKINYLDLPPPIKYEDIQRETLMALKPEVFEASLKK